MPKQAMSTGELRDEHMGPDLVRYSAGGMMKTSVSILKCSCMRPPSVSPSCFLCVTWYDMVPSARDSNFCQSMHSDQL